MILPIISVYAIGTIKLLPAFQQIYSSVAIIRANIPAFESIQKDLYDSSLRGEMSKKVEEIKCFPIFVSKKVQIPESKNIFLTGDAFYSFPPSFAQGASQSIEAANELFNDLKNNSSNYYKSRILKTKQINSRSSLNHFAFHLSNPLNVFFRDIVLKYISKNKNFLENYLGKIYNN